MKVLRVSFMESRRFARVAFNPLQASYLDEQCIQVNRNDEPLGMVTKEECHKSRRFLSLLKAPKLLGLRSGTISVRFFKIYEKLLKEGKMEILV